jgi:hypothetical protein
MGNGQLRHKVFCGFGLCSHMEAERHIDHKGREYRRAQQASPSSLSAVISSANCLFSYPTIYYMDGSHLWVVIEL